MAASDLESGLGDILTRREAKGHERINLDELCALVHSDIVFNPLVLRATHALS